MKDTLNEDSDYNELETMKSLFQHEIFRRDSVIDNLQILIGNFQQSLLFKNRDIVECSKKNKSLLELNKNMHEEISSLKNREKYLNKFIDRYATGSRTQDLDEFITEEKYNDYMNKKDNKDVRPK